ncbi:hypothetical protein ACRRTK_001619 [Alexandromys fortis]
MAEYLASIFGTEKDKVNCSFYFKIGACRHGDRCSRLHNKPTFSQTIVLLNLYRNPQNTAQTADGSHCHVSDVEVQEHYDNFFEEVFTELQEKYGEIEEMNVCDNLGDHLVGNVYVKFRREEDAERAVTELNNHWFNRQAVHESPVTDFRESCCWARWGNVPEVASATSCTYDPYPGTCTGSSMGKDPGIGHPQDPIQATVPEKGTGAVPQTTGMVASETGAPVPRPRVQQQKMVTGRYSTRQIPRFPIRHISGSPRPDLVPTTKYE